jgi:hypothetical protein
MPIDTAGVNMTSNYRFLAPICNRRANKKIVRREKSAACCPDSLQEDSCSSVVEEHSGHVLYDGPERLEVCYVSIPETR